MNKNKLFLLEIERFVENGLSLNEALIIELQRKYERNPKLILQLYQLLSDQRFNIKKHSENIDAVVYELLITEEMKKSKTFYGAVVYVAELFDLSETYIRCIVTRYLQGLLDLKHTA